MGLCANEGGGKLARDLKDATQLEDGHAKEDPCFAPYIMANRMMACLVVKRAVE